MEIVKNPQKRTIAASETTTIHEYDTENSHISGATAEIKGRYPNRGYVINKSIKELVYVLSGHGRIITPEGSTDIGVGDVVFVDYMEKFAWDGSMTIFMATTPKFDPDQHVEID